MSQSIKFFTDNVLDHSWWLNKQVEQGEFRLTWRQMYRQFGVDPTKASDKRTVDNFRTKCLRELKKIKLAWPELNYSTAPGLLILHPSRPAIPPSDHPQLAN